METVAETKTDLVPVVVLSFVRHTGENGEKVMVAKVSRNTETFYTDPATLECTSLDVLADPGKLHKKATDAVRNILAAKKQ